MQEPKNANPILNILQKIFLLLGRGSTRQIGWFLFALYLWGYLVWYIEPDTFENPVDYTYWFVATATTIGYGDISPQSYWGRILAMPIMIFSIILLPVIFTKMVLIVVDIRDKKKKGLKPVSKNIHNHTIIIGYRKEETQNLIDELLLDPEENKSKIYLMSEECEEAPIPGINFISGKLTDPEAQERAGFDRAAKIVIYRRDDNATVFAATLMDSLAPQANIAVIAHTQTAADLFKKSNLKARVVRPLAVKVLAQEIQDKGASEIIFRMVSNETAQTLYTSPIVHAPEKTNIEALRTYLKAAHDGALLMSLCRSGTETEILNPDDDVLVHAGDKIGYCGKQRIPPLEIPSTLRNQA